MGLRFLKGNKTRDELLIRYTNGAKQVIELTGKTLIPRFCISRDLFEFESVHLKRSAKLGLVLSNPTRVDVIWKIVPEEDTKTSSFHFSTGNGVLKGPTIAGNSGLVRSYPAAGRSG